MASGLVSVSTGHGSSPSCEHCVVLLGETPYSCSASLAYFYVKAANPDTYFNCLAFIKFPNEVYTSSKFYRSFPLKPGKVSAWKIVLEAKYKKKHYVYFKHD